MTKKLPSILLVALFCLFVQQVRADGILLSWSGRDVQGVTERSFNEAKQLSVEQISKNNLAVRSWADAYLLIVALKPNEAKDRTTKDCLQRLYKTDKLSSDESSPASLCSPDTLTHRYLSIVTDVKDKHDHDWWKSWWEKNQSKLEWKREQGKFVVKN